MDATSKAIGRESPAGAWARGWTWPIATASARVATNRRCGLMRRVHHETWDCGLLSTEIRE